MRPRNNENSLGIKVRVHIPGKGKHVPCFSTKEVQSVTTLLTHASSDWMRITNERTARETTAWMFSTSGTTGMPKVCRLSHHAEIAKNMSIQSEGKGLRCKESRLHSIPPFHIFGAGLIHVDPIRKGEPMNIMSRFDLKKYVSMIERYSITDTACTPLMVVYLLKSGLPLKALLKTLRYVWCGSAPIDAALLLRFYDVLAPNAIITVLWGMSETGAHTCFKWPERDTTGSVGRLTPGAEIRLLDDLGREITSDNTPGEAWVRSAQVMTCYHENPAAMLETIVDDWLHTGDICYLSGGKWYVIGRKKELIKVGGCQAAPAELEAVLLSHPQTFDPAVLGVKMADSEAPRAFVMRTPSLDVEKAN